jgi:putative ATP-dependent DNA ligase
MNLERAAKKLGISLQRLQSLQETVVKTSSWPEPQLLRFEKEASGVEAGTVIFESGEVVFGYPKIRRAMMLAPALEKHFPDTLAVEEKMNGHNVRITSVDGEVIALTRGGFVCPYSSEVARKILPEGIFDADPDLVLCGEMVGPENPYVPKSIYPTDTIDFYLFDLAHKNGKKTLGVHRTHRFADEHHVKATALLGEFRKDRAAEKIKRIIKQLGRRGREGVVIKDTENKVPALKYTSSEANRDDLAFAFRYYNDHALDFFVSRAVREGFQSVEWLETPDERKARALRLGESILMPLVETIEKKQAGENIVQKVQIRVRSLQTAREFEFHLRRSGIRAIFDSPEPIDDGYLIRITKLIMSTNDKTQALLEGEMW